MSPDERALRMLNIGYGNVVAGGRVVAIVSPQSAPMKRLRDWAEGEGKLIDGSPSTAPCVKGLDGSTATIAIVFSLRRSSAVSAAVRVLFPAPAFPVIPTT
jgi:hypothetical protein